MPRRRGAAAEARIKRLLLEQARRAGLDPAELAEWLRYEAGVNVRPSWEAVERAVLREPIPPQALAAYLVSEGVEVDEEEWLRALGSGASLYVNRRLGRRKSVQS